MGRQGLGECFSARSGSVSPAKGRYESREHFGFARPGIGNSSLPQYVDHREQRGRLRRDFAAQGAGNPTRGAGQWS